MSRLADLIARAKATDPQLGANLEQEFAALSSQVFFELNFERHAPEAVELPRRPMRPSAFNGKSVRRSLRRNHDTAGGPRVQRCGRSASHCRLVARHALTLGSSGCHSTPLKVFSGNCQNGRRGGHLWSRSGNFTA